MLTKEQLKQHIEAARAILPEIINDSHTPAQQVQTAEMLGELGLRLLGSVVIDLKRIAEALERIQPPNL